MSHMVSISEWLFKRKTIFYYLILPDQVAKVVEINPSDKFDAVTARYMQAYIQDGTMPPQDVATAIMNMADDHMAGRPITIRSGDYLAIQNHLRSMGGKNT
jgi:hypothetical protein